MKRSIFFLLLTFMMAWNQAQVPVGVFRDHLPYHSFYSLAVAEDVVYAAGENSLMYVYRNQADAYEPTYYKWSKVDGLSDVLLTKVAYDKASGYMVIAYDNGNLDFVKGEALTNIPDIKNKQIIGSKQVADIYFDENYCCLVYPFGVVRVNLKKLLIKDTWYTNRVTDLQSRGLTMTNNRYYLATSKGVYSIDKDNLALADFAAWQREEELPVEDFNLIVNFKDVVYVNRHSYQINPDYSTAVADSIFALIGGNWQYMPEIPTIETHSLRVSDNELLYTTWQYYGLFDGLQTQIEDGFSHGLLQFLTDADLDGDWIWLTDKYNGLWACSRKSPKSVLLADDGPYSCTSYALSCENGTLASAPGAYNGWAPAYEAPSCSFFKNEKWSYLNSEFYSFSDNSHDMVNVAVDPQNPDICYVASWGDGLYKCKDGAVIEHYTAENSTLTVDAQGYTLVSGLCFDQYHNLWVTNTNSPTTINVLKNDGSWTAMPRLSTTLGDVAHRILVDSRGYKWICFPRSSIHSLYVFDNHNTIDDFSDDNLTVVDMNAAATVESSSVRCMAEDKDGRMWFGTDKGIKVLYTPAKVFAGTSLPQNVLLQQGGYTSVLLEFEVVTAIAVDGANRKWIGTEKAGVFLMDENGTTELLHLTAENSSLLSNVIHDIAVNGLTGEVFFATDRGICSYRGTASEGREDYSEVTVFPNPVRSGYTGVITVNGLMEKSFCKVVDAAGNLLWQGYANGGELVWNGMDMRGNRPATGVYYVFCSDKTGKEKKVAKLLFIN